MRTCLYRHYDYNDVLLYVGIASNPVVRGSSHKHNSDWYAVLSRTEYEWFNTREFALAAERRAIRLESPLHNVTHNHGSFDIHKYLEIEKIREVLKCVSGFMHDYSHDDYYMIVVNIHQQIVDYFAPKLCITQEELIDDVSCDLRHYAKGKIDAEGKIKINRIIVSECIFMVDIENKKKQKKNSRDALEDIRSAMVLIRSDVRRK